MYICKHNIQVNAGRSNKAAYSSQWGMKKMNASVVEDPLFEGGGGCWIGGVV